jgi:uncharacterized protein (DUF58 family)
MLLLFMLIAGLNYTNSLALFVTFLLAGFMLVAMHQCHRNLLKVTLVDAGTRPTFAGEFGSLHLSLGNDSTLPRYRLEVTARDEPAVVVDVPPQSVRRAEVPIPAPTRGIIRIDRLRLSTSHPFGLFRVWTWVHVPLTLTVYPRPNGSLPMPAQGGLTPGRHLRGSGAQDEWLSLRAFREGDSPRQVDWKAYARGSPLLVKEYGASAAELRIFDFSQLSGLDTEARLQQLTRWIVDAHARGERYGLILLNTHIPPDIAPEHRHACLSALALHGLKDPVYAGRKRRR